MNSLTVSKPIKYFNIRYLQRSLPSFPKSIIRFQSTLINTDSAIEINQTITTKEGSIGIIVEKSRGWYSVKLSDSGVVKKFRLKDIVFENNPTPKTSLNLSTIIPNPPILTQTQNDSSKYKNYTIPLLQPPPLHANVDKWIIFSDLHVKTSSIDTCERILDNIHEEAVKRKAGIIFLGDFWHVRGTLNVELLNRVLRVLRKWTQPVIAIPGNHDQVNLGGQLHALEPLKYAFNRDQILMLDDPVVCMGALWIPYRRDKLFMKAILEDAWNRTDISVIFCHADVQGAWMNDNIQSREGLDVSSFPPNLPIFSGHFHKPHLIEKRNHSLRYVGSPYQTSLSEADQVKYLYEMEITSRDNPLTSPPSLLYSWNQTEQWPINFGRKYVKVANLSDPKIETCQEGDRLVVTVPMHSQDEADNLAREMRLRGVEVELRAEKSQFIKLNESGEIILSSDNSTLSSEPKGLELDDTDPITLFKVFLNGLDISSLNSSAAEKAKTNETNALSDEMSLENAILMQKILEEGVATIEKIIHSESGGNLITKNKEVHDLKLETLELNNFGPYGGAPVKYPLEKRGLVLIRGQAMDSTGADSNGSGKTTLAMSILWCLTGSLDVRLTNEAKTAEVTFDQELLTEGKSAKRVASVILKGKINNKDFVLSRRRNGKKNELNFFIDGQDLTAQSIKDTQARVDYELGITNNILQRCYFFGQHSHTSQSLLGLTDTKLKEELVPVVNADIWATAASEVRAKARIISQQIQEKNITISLLQTDLEKHKFKSLAAEKTLNETKTNFQFFVDQNPIFASNLTGTVQVFNSSIDDMLSMSGLQRFDLILQDLEKQKQSCLAELTPLRNEVRELFTVNPQLKRALNPSNYDINVLQTKYNNISSEMHGLNSHLEGLSKSFNEEKEHLTQQQTKSFEIIEKILPLLSPSSSSPFSANNNSPKPFSSAFSSKNNNNYNNNYNNNNSNSQSSLKVRLSSDIRYAESEARKQKQLLEEYISQLGAADEQIKSINSNLQSLIKPLSTGETTHSCSSTQQQPSSIHKLGVQFCPSCGQTLPELKLQQMKDKLTKDLQILLQRRQELQQKMNKQQEMQQYLLDLLPILQESNRIQNLIQTLNLDINTKQNKITSLTKELQQIQHLINEENLMHSKYNEELQQTIQNKTNAINQLEQQHQHIHTQILTINKERNDLQTQIQNQEKVFSQLQTQYNYLLKELQLIENQYQERLQTLQSNENQINILEQEKKILFEQSLLFEKLIFLFGSRGIQNYIFQYFISQLEQMTNKYLNVLTQNGIQIQLKNDPESDRIVKIILIRSTSSGEYKERALAQLSGGQWRRVSLALDLAYTELIRKKGTLRSNVLVMDEILTHLDAQGREAVGTLLKTIASAENNQDDRICNWPFETVLVILQDLAASELEESFDAIDVVIKEGDVSHVELDNEVY